MRIVLNSLQIGRCSLIFTALLMHTTTLTISTKIFLRLILASLFRPELFIKSFLQSLLTLPSSVPQHFSTPYVCVQQSVQVFSLPQPFSQFRLNQGTSKQGSLVRTDTIHSSSKCRQGYQGSQWLILYRSVSEKWFLADSCLWWRYLESEWKTIQPSFPIPPTWCHYFHTNTIARELRFPYKPVALLDFHSKFSILKHYSRPFPPICFEVLPSYHRILSPIKLWSKTIRPQQQRKDKDMWLQCLAVVH